VSNRGRAKERQLRANGRVLGEFARERVFSGPYNACVRLHGVRGCTHEYGGL
jgi:hypothetical protein